MAAFLENFLPAPPLDRIKSFPSLPRTVSGPPVGEVCAPENKLAESVRMRAWADVRERKRQRERREGDLSLSFFPYRGLW